MQRGRRSVSLVVFTTSCVPNRVKWKVRTTQNMYINSQKTNKYYVHDVGGNNIFKRNFFIRLHFTQGDEKIHFWNDLFTRKVEIKIFTSYGSKNKQPILPESLVRN